MPKVKKDKAAIHPNSRKALQLARQMFRDEKLQKRKDETNLKQKSKLNKLKWFKENIDASKEVYSTTEVKDLVDRYLKRFESETEKEVPKSLKRHLSSSTFQDYKTKFLVDKERQDFESGGLEIPDLIQKSSFKVFKAWNGDADLLPAITLMNVSKKKLEKSVQRVQSHSETDKCQSDTEHKNDDVDVYI